MIIDVMLMCSRLEGLQCMISVVRPTSVKEVVFCQFVDWFCQDYLLCRGCIFVNFRGLIHKIL